MIRLLSLLGGLSVATDLGTGSGRDESLQRAVVSVRLARAAGCAEPEVADVLYTALLQHVGCTAYSHELAQIFGDDIAATHFGLRADPSGPVDLWREMVPGIARATERTRLRVLASAMAAGSQLDSEATTATCEVARQAADALGLRPPVRQALSQVTARWDGRGTPPVAGADLPIAVRVTHVASIAVLIALEAGPTAAAATVRHRCRGQLDPGLVDVFMANSDALLDGIGTMDGFDAVLDLEPDPVVLVGPERLEEVAATFGELADLKSPWLLGHSAAVADLAGRAAEQLALPLGAATVRLAGHLHDLGRAAVSSRIWDKDAPWTSTERDQARLHAHHSERVVARVPELAEVARLVGRHHEHVDGSGYHRGLRAPDLDAAAQVLAAADAYRLCVQPRPGRPGETSAAAATALRAAGTRGWFDGDVVEAVLAAAGHSPRRRTGRAGGLSARQVDVLRLVAAGLSNGQIAQRLVITRRTAEHHVQDVYARIGCHTRAGAALFAMQHGLLAEGEIDRA